MQVRYYHYHPSCFMAYGKYFIKLCFFSPHPPFSYRAKWPSAALLVRTFGIWSLRWSPRAVGIVPSGCGATPHADCRSHGAHVQHHPGHHEGDCVRGGSCTWTLQRSQHELGQGANCGWNQLHHLRPHSDPAEEAAPDGLHSSIIAIGRWKKRKMGQQDPRWPSDKNQRK